METKAHFEKSWAIGIRKVFASLTSVVIRRSFSPRSMAPVNDRARLPRCASSSCDHFFFFRNARTRLPRRFLTAVAFSIQHTIKLPSEHRQRSVVGLSAIGYHRSVFAFHKLNQALANVANIYVHETAGPVTKSEQTTIRLATCGFRGIVRCSERAGFAEGGQEKNPH